MKNQLNDIKFWFINGSKSIKKYFDIKDGMVFKNENLMAYFNLFEKN